MNLAARRRQPPLDHVALGVEAAHRHVGRVTGQGRLRDQADQLRLDRPGAERRRQVADPLDDRAERHRQRVVDVWLPQLFPYLMAATRGGLALIWKIVLVVELLGRSDGVGFQLHMAFQVFDVASILAYSLAFIAVVQLIELLVLQPLERRATCWRSAGFQHA